MAVGIMAWAPASLAENFGEELANMFTNGEFDVNFRYRYEFVDSDTALKNANASTLRTRLVFKTAKWNDFDVTINMDDVRPIVGHNFNDTRNGKTQYSVVADPKGTDLNIAALTYSGLKNTTIIGGRQRIIRGNARFIGNVGWRQNEQTYDALSANYKGSNFTANYAYIDQVKRIFGPEDGIPTKDFSSDSHLLDAAYTMSDALSVSVYGYFLDFKNSTAAEYATQDDYGDNTTNYSADYVLAELGFKWNWLGLKAGYELLEGNGTLGHQFRTPLATLHAHNGWVDRFLLTPTNGLQDTYIAASAKVSKGTLKLILHDFSQDTGSGDYGTEIDFLAKWPLGKHYSVLAKLGIYSGDSNATGAFAIDTTKAWLMMTAAF